MAKRQKRDSSLPPRSLKSLSSKDQAGTEVVLANWFTASDMFSQWYNKLNQLISEYDFDHDGAFTVSIKQDGQLAIDDILELHAEVGEAISELKGEIETCPGDIHSPEKLEILTRHTDVFRRWSSRIQQVIASYTHNLD